MNAPDVLFTTHEPRSAGLPARPRVAVVGSGIAGLAAAWSLRRHANVTLYEAGEHFGGHVNTVDVTVDGVTHAVDTGFLVLNQRTYPGLLALFAELGIDTAASDMSFSVQRPRPGGGWLEWSGASLDTVFAQRGNLLRPAFWHMLRDIVRFNREATALARAGRGPEEDARTVGEFLRQGRYGDPFVHGYFLPMVACIWSCPTAQMMAFPVATMVRFCDNHGLLQVEGRPQWLTVPGGARRYVERIVAQLPDTRLRTPVLRVRRHDVGVEIATPGGTEWFDHVVLACHSDQALAVLADADARERQLLGAIRYQPNRAVVHTDASLLPRLPKARAAWNFESAVAADDLDAHAAGPAVCLHYLINRLQPVPFGRPVVVSLNPLREPDPRTVLREITYSHPVFDSAAIAAQREVEALQGNRRSYFCGAWCGFGFHEDGLRSGQAAAQAWLEDRRQLANSAAPGGPRSEAALGPLGGQRAAPGGSS
jgi:predicted NAD/FAD-binding protein